MPDLTTRYLGLPLKNPIVPSSTPLTRDADAPLHLEDAGAAAIVMHSLFEEDVRNDERMFDRFLIHPEAFGEASGHLPAPTHWNSTPGTCRAALTKPAARSRSATSPCSAN